MAHLEQENDQLRVAKATAETTADAAVTTIQTLRRTIVSADAHNASQALLLLASSTNGTEAGIATHYKPPLTHSHYTSPPSDPTTTSRAATAAGRARVAAAAARRAAADDDNYTLCWLDKDVNKLAIYRRKGITSQELTPHERQRLQGQAVVVDWAKVEPGATVTRLRMLGDTIDSCTSNPANPSNLFTTHSPPSITQRTATTKLAACVHSVWLAPTLWSSSAPGCM